MTMFAAGFVACLLLVAALAFVRREVRLFERARGRGETLDLSVPAARGELDWEWPQR